MTAPRDASFDDYMVEAMKDPVQAAAYIEAVIELNDPAAPRWPGVPMCLTKTFSKP